MEFNPMLENVRNQAVAVGTSPVLLSTSRMRQELVITNTSSAAQTITLAFGTQAAATVGIFLNPYSSYYASASEGFRVYAGEIWAIGSAVAGQVSIFER